jgi:hypothetical protein
MHQADRAQCATLGRLDLVTHNCETVSGERTDQFKSIGLRCLGSALFPINTANGPHTLQNQIRQFQQIAAFFTVEGNRIVFQRGYWDKLSFLKKHRLPIE